VIAITAIANLVASQRITLFSMAMTDHSALSSDGVGSTEIRCNN